MATYTTATLVRKQVENIDASLTDSDIDEFIEEAEGILDAVMESSFISSFDAAKHKILRAGANKWAAIAALNFNPEDVDTTSEAYQIIDTLWDQFEKVISILEKESAVRYLEGL